LLILDKGEVKAHGSMSSLRQVLSRCFELRFLEPLTPEQEARIAEIGTLRDNMNGMYDVELKEADAGIPFKWAESIGVVLVQVTPRHDRLDEILIRAISRPLN